MDVVHAKQISTSLFPDFSGFTFVEILIMLGGWGLGYFGQPHIVTKFMGIRNVNEISKSKWIGMSWMTISLAAATLVGIVSIAYFKEGIPDSEQVFIEMVKLQFPAFLVGFILCAVLAATINAMSSQVLVLSSSLTEDFYKRIFRKEAGSSELLLVSRLGVLIVAILALIIAYAKISTIYSLVLYAWSGLGASFGPLIILSLYSKVINKYGAWAGVLIGGSVSATWPYFNQFFSMQIPALIIAFPLSFSSILLVSFVSNRLSSKTVSKIT